MIKESFIEDLKSKLDIVDVISSIVKLNKKGNSNIGLCPFHNESSPSFHASRERQIYKCFGCGVSGDAIAFITNYYRKTYIESIEFLADFYHLTIEYERETIEQKKVRENSKDEKIAMKEALALAQSMYVDSLAKKLDDSPVWQYLLGRGITREIAGYWGLGYAPYDRKFISTPLINDGKYSPAEKIGIIHTNEDNETKDFYCNRITIPIRDIKGDVISMSGRLIPSSDKEKDASFPKYINLENSLLYNKSETLYGIYEAFTAKAFANRTKPVLLVEGYFDVISLHEKGVKNTVASCGTSVTIKQISIIKKISNAINIFLDGTKEEKKNGGKTSVNKSGEDAMLKVIDLCISENYPAYVIDTPGYDPDEFARKYQQVKLIEE